MFLFSIFPYRLIFIFNVYKCQLSLVCDLKFHNRQILFKYFKLCSLKIMLTMSKRSENFQVTKLGRTYPV
jgi:hypothetical protein